MKETWSTSTLSEQIDLAVLLAGLSKHYALLEDDALVETLCYLDTFDWRLYDKGLLCRRQGRSYVLTDFSGEYLLQADGPTSDQPLFRDFEGAMNEKLAEVIGVRALLPLVEIVRRRQSFQIVNHDQKRVLSGLLEQDHLMQEGGSPIPLGGSLRVEGVRGYSKIMAKVTAILQRQGFEAGYSAERGLRSALAAMGRKPLDYCSQFSIRLDPTETIVQAAQKIFLQLLAGMERNIPGMIEDIDSEFLHDFRVALRRTRSLLGSLKKTVSGAEVESLQQELQKIGLVTGPVRDLDVYLLEESGYHAMLPEGLQEGLAVFFKGLRRQRVKEFRRLQKALQAKTFHQFLLRWRRYVEDLETSLLPSDLTTGHETCKKVAVKAIRKRLRAILKDGALIGPQSPDADLHSVRIQAKKLRYLLEFYRSLFPEPAMDSLVKSLKKLQDNLGSFNDLSVQQQMLARYQNGLADGEPKKAVLVAAALGGLITHLHEEQVNVRQKFDLAFAQFTTAENRKLFHSLV
jgi:CHAD domain-containing protein